MVEWNWTMIVGVLVVIQFIFNIYSHCIIKFNDFAHLNKDMFDIKESQKQHGICLSEISNRVSYLEGREGTKRRVRTKKISSKKTTKRRNK